MHLIAMIQKAKTLDNYQKDQLKLILIELKLGFDGLFNEVFMPHVEIVVEPYFLAPSREAKCKNSLRAHGKEFKKVSFSNEPI